MIAVIAVPTATHLALFGTQCYQYCAARGYDVAGVITGNLIAAFEMLANHTADVLVVARQSHVGSVVDPRIEVVAQAVDQPSPRHRRSQIIRPGAEE